VTHEKISIVLFLLRSAMLDGHSTAGNHGVATFAYPGCQ
jgi:hypothetical protein